VFGVAELAGDFGLGAVAGQQQFGHGAGAFFQDDVQPVGRQGEGFLAAVDVGAGY